MIECTDENINNALARINKAKHLDIDSDNEDERMGQLMILCIQEGFREAIDQDMELGYSDENTSIAPLRLQKEEEIVFLDKILERLGGYSCGKHKQLTKTIINRKKKIKRNL